MLPCKHGFTLVEAVISMAILVLVIAGSYKLVSGSQALIYAARNHYVAINISRARLERVRNFGYDQLILLAESKIEVDDSGAPSSGGYFRRTTLVTVMTNLMPGLTKVEVRTEIRNTKSLSFVEVKGVAENESLATFATEYLTR